jgi:ASPIC and UnbV
MGQPATAAGMAGRFLTRFSNVTGSAGVHVAGLGNASSWVDYDGAYGQDSLALEFGVGAAPGPFRVRILWPNGAVQILTAQVNRVTSVIEP